MLYSQHMAGWCAIIKDKYVKTFCTMLDVPMYEFLLHYVAMNFFKSRAIAKSFTKSRRSAGRNIST